MLTSFRKQALGLDISRDGLKMALLGGKRKNPRLLAFSADTFPEDTIHFSFRELNIINPSRFVRSIRENHIKLASSTVRASVTLPDSVGRVMILDLETRFKNRQEGADIIRWKLKKGFPLNVESIHIDYQVLRISETGGMLTLVSVITRDIISQYEDLLVEAGLEPNQIDFSTFSTYRLFLERLEISPNSAFISIFGGILGITVFYEGLLEFYRAKEMPVGNVSAERIFREVNSSLAAYRANHPGHQYNEVFCSAPFNDTSDFASVVAEATDMEPLRLIAGDFISGSNGIFCKGETLQGLTPALGAAMRNL